MELIRKEKRFSLYVNGEAVDVPKEPTYDGDLISYDRSMAIQIRETVPGKELTWFLFRDGDRCIWLCDRNLIHNISRKDCNLLIYPTIIEGKKFLLTKTSHSKNGPRTLKTQ